MKTQVRMRCFESNSSSMHSVVTSKTTGIYTPEEFHEDIYIDKKGEWHFYSSSLDFGRSPYEILCTFEGKVRYALASLCGIYLNEEVIEKNYSEIERIIFKYLPDCKDITFTRQYKRRYIRETDGEAFSWIIEDEGDYEPHGKYDYRGRVYGDDNTYYFKCMEYEYDDTGCVDHQSMGVLYNFLEKNNVSLEEFLTHKEYWVVIDGDEYYEFEKQYKHQIINVNNIANIYPPLLKGDESEEEIVEYYKARETAPEIVEDDSYFQTTLEVKFRDKEVNKNEE